MCVSKRWGTRLADNLLPPGVGTVRCRASWGYPDRDLCRTFVLSRY